METEENIQQQITKLEQAHSQLQSKSLKLVDQIQSLEDELTKIKSDIQKIALPQQRQQHEIIEKGKIQQLQKQIKNLEDQYLLASAALAQTENFDHQASSLVQAQRQLKSKLLQAVSIDDSDLKRLQTQITKCKQNVDQQTLKNKTIQAEIKRSNQELVHAQKEIDSIVIQPIDKVAIEKSAQQRKALEKQISSLEKQLMQIESLIRNQKERKTSEQLKQKTLLQNANKQLLSLKLQVSNIEKQHSKLTQKLNKESLDISNSEVFIKLAKVQTEITQKEAEKQQFIKKISLINQQIKREEQRINNQQKKEQNKSNVKDIIKKAEKESIKLKNQKQSIQAIYNRLVATKKGYVSIQNLQILQRQLQRHQRLNGPSSQAKQNQLQKIQKQNKGLKQSIKRLNRLRKEIEAREQKNINDTKKKIDTLNTQKIQLDKDLVQANFKINEYKKRFPNHQSQKQEKKKIKLKKTDSIDGQFHLPKKEKKKKEVVQQDLQFKILGDDDDVEEFDPSRRQSAGTELLKKTKWYKRRSSHDFEIAPDKPLYQSTYFIAAVALLLILIIAAIK